MIHYDEQLQNLKQQILRKKHLESQLKELNSQKYDLEDKVRILKIKKDYEQEDVDRLEGRSLAAFFYGVVGKKDEKLDKERSEAYAAAVKYDAGARELEDVETAIRRSENELKALSGCEEKYESVLREKASAIKAANMLESSEIMKLEEQAICMESRKKEIGEAIFVGEEAGKAADAVIEKLNSAENWGTWDLLGGGIISDIAKHSALDEAQTLIEEMQLQLRRFKTELADVTIDAEMQINVSEFLRFADYFFDGLFTDLAVLKRISKSLEQVKNVRKQIDEVLDNLGSMYAETENSLAQAKEKLDKLVTETSV